MSDPMTDPMDARLRAAALRWQAQQPPPPGLQQQQLPGRPAGARRWLPAAVAAAAVAGAVVLGSAVLPRNDHPAPAAPPPTPSPGPTAALPGVPWLDLPATHPRGAAKYRSLDAEGDLDLPARPGSRLTFTIYLTALDATSLDPCPDYTVSVGAARGVRRSLNCTAVPYVDASGVPYLPAHVPVAFEMRLTVPDLRGEQKILWVLNGPRSVPGTHGLLSIHP